MRNLIILTALFLSLFPVFAFCQNTSLRDLSGRVVEIVNQKPVGVADVEVVAEDLHRDFTRADGSFMLKIPEDRDYITIVLKSTPYKMISPYSGIVNLPPKGSLQVIICGEQNRKLLDEIDLLNARLGKLQQANDLSRRQIAAMHSAMVDTILFFQAQLQQLEFENQNLHLEQEKKDKRIRELEFTQRKLMRDLEVALQEKYLRQKAEFDQISRELKEYLSRLKDLRIRATPSKLTEYFRNRAAVPDLKNAKNAYNDAWQTITVDHQNHILAVRKNWESPRAFEALEKVYAYLLEDVHQQWVRPVDEQVFGPLAAYLSNQTGRMRAERESKNASEEMVPDLVSAIHELERRIQLALEILEKNI